MIKLRNREQTLIPLEKSPLCQANLLPLFCMSGLSVYKICPGVYTGYFQGGGVLLPLTLSLMYATECMVEIETNAWCFNKSLKGNIHISINKSKRYKLDKYSYMYQSLRSDLHLRMLPVPSNGTSPSYIEKKIQITAIPHTHTHIQVCNIYLFPHNDRQRRKE